MSGRRRLYCAFLILLGLATFFQRSITTEHPVRGRSQWSPFEILSEMQAGTLPVAPLHPSERPWWLHPVAIDLLPVYLLLLAGLLGDALSSSPTPLLWTAVLDCLFAWDLRRPASRYFLARLLYPPSERIAVGHRRYGIHLAQYWLLLVVINALVLGIIYMNQREWKRGTRPEDVEAPSSAEADEILAPRPDRGDTRNSREK